MSCMLVSDSVGRRSSVRVFERLPVLAGGLSFLGVVHFRGLDVLLLGTKVLLTILQKDITSLTSTTCYKRYFSSACNYLKQAAKKLLSLSLQH